jgi:hypothetical protein
MLAFDDLGDRAMQLYIFERQVFIGVRKGGDARPFLP